MDNVAIDHELLQKIHKYRRQSFTAPAVKLLTVLSTDNASEVELTESEHHLFHLQDMLHQDSRGHRLEPVKMSTKGRYTPCPENAAALMPCTFNDNINIQDTAGCVSANNLIGATTEEVVKALLKQRVYRSICRRNAEKLKAERAHVEAFLAQIEEGETKSETEDQPETEEASKDSNVVDVMSAVTVEIEQDTILRPVSSNKSYQDVEDEILRQADTMDEQEISQGSKAENSLMKRRDNEVEERAVMLLQCKKIQEDIDCKLPLPVRLVVLDTAIPIVEETYKKYKKVLGLCHSLTEEADVRLKELKRQRSLYYD